MKFMTQSNSSYPFKYSDQYLSYQSLFPHFNIKIFKNFDKKFNELLIEEKVLELFSGKKINISEDRAALHHIYRSAYGHKVSCVNEHYIENAKKTISHCSELKNFLLNNGIKNIVTIGIGGSFEGPKLLIETLTKKHSRNFNHIFITGPDKHEFKDQILPLNKEETFFVISSKSFSTDETLQSFSLAKDWIGNDLKFENHFICITSQIHEAKNYGFNKKTTILFPNEIGGRYSLWSPISFSAILELNERFYDFLKGGSEADKQLTSNIDYKNFIKSIVFSDLWHNNFKGLNTRVLLIYSWNLRFLSDYVQQLEMESIGKAASNNSKFQSTGQTIFGGFGSTAQHSYFQLLHQGTSSFCADIINIEKDRKDNALLFAQSKAQSNLLAFGADDGLKDYEKVKGGTPVNLFTLKKLDPFTLGYLLAFWEHRVFLTSCMLEINPYDQYGVSAGKIFAKKYLDENGG